MLSLIILVIFCISFASAFIIEVWANTDVFVEYMELIRFNNLFFIEDYREVVANGYGRNYVGFLSEYHNCFLVRLLYCPTCLSFWLSLFTSIGMYLYTGGIEYLWLLLPSAFLNLFFYRLLNKLT